MLHISRITILSALLAALLGSSSVAESPAILLEKGIYQEETVGDLDAAIAIFQDVIKEVKKSNKYASQAYYRLGKCYLKKQQNPQAIKAFKQVINLYPEEKDLVELAENGLALAKGKLSRSETAKLVDDAIKTISSRTDGDPDVITAVESVSDLNRKVAVEELTKYLTSTDGPARRSAIYILWKGKFDTIDEAVEVLTKLLNHQEEQTRGLAALALGSQKVSSSLKAITTVALTDKDAYARRAATYALGLLGDPAAIPAVKKALEDENNLVRSNAEAALKMLTGKAETAGKNRLRYFVKLVLGKDSMTFQGKVVRWKDLPELLDCLPNRQQTVLEVGTDGNIPSDRLMDALGLAPAHGLEYGSYVGQTELGSTGSPAQKIPTTERSTSSTELKAKLIYWVERFFSQNFRDITERKTLEWGEPVTKANGNFSIRYKYLATVWDKERLVIEQSFIFSPEGEYVSAETLEKGPADKLEPAFSPDAVAVSQGFVDAMRDSNTEEALQLLSDDFQGTKSELSQFSQYMDFSKIKRIATNTKGNSSRTAFSPAIVKADQKRFFLCLELVRNDNDSRTWKIRNVFFNEDEDAEDRKQVIRYVKDINPPSSHTAEVESANQK